MIRFQKTFVFPIDFNDFMHLWDYLGVTLGALASQVGVILGVIFMKTMEDNGRKVKMDPKIGI